jgi:type VI secretion system protein ImpI
MRGAGVTGPAGRAEPPAPQVDSFSGVAAGAAAEPATISPEPTPTPVAPAPGSASTGAASPASGLASRWADGTQASQAQPAPTPRAAGDAGDFVAAFERGAGMPAGSVSERGDEALAEELGRLFRLVTQNLQAMLAARAETKSAMRSSERTMIGALENNPLKFSPTPEDALRIMFGAKTRSYLDATQTVESSFRDLQQHQVQTFAAMQQALQALIEDLDPNSIEEATSKDGGLAGIVGSRRAKFWDTYVERFRAKSARHERGLIDAFMILFAEMYDRQR